MKKYHYVYKITNLNPQDERKYYIGVRTSKISPEEDIEYMSSSKYLKEAIEKSNKSNFKKEILSEWETREDASLEEIKLHDEFDVAKNPEFYNKSKQKSTGFDTAGVITQMDRVAVIDTITGETKQVSRTEYKENDHLISVKKDKVNVIDLRDGSRKQVSKKEFDTFDYYVSYMTGLLVVIDIRDNITKLVSKEDYHKYDYYVSPKTGRMNVIDIRDGKGKQVSKEDYHKYDYYVSTSARKYNIYDINGFVVYTVFGSFGKFCKEKNLPHQALMDSHKAGGKPIFQSPYSRTKDEFKKYKGWYAIEVEK
jgi:hypothetical protein